jgi:hypothetical protein
MYARIGRAPIKPGLRAEAEAFCAEFAASSGHGPAPRYWINLITENDELIVIGVYPTEEERAAAALRNVQRWQSCRHLLAQPPTFTYAEMTQFVTRN